MSNNREYVDLGHALAMIKRGEMAHSTLEAAMAQCIESNLAEIERLEAANEELIRGMTEMAERFTAAMDKARAAMPHPSQQGRDT